MSEFIIYSKILNKRRGDLLNGGRANRSFLTRLAVVNNILQERRAGYLLQGEVPPRRDSTLNIKRSGMLFISGKSIVLFYN